MLPDGTRPPIWFALNETRALAFFAGIRASKRTSVQKLKGKSPTSRRAERFTKKTQLIQSRGPHRDFLHLVAEIDEGYEPIESTLRLARMHFEAEYGNPDFEESETETDVVSQ